MKHILVIGPNKSELEALRIAKLKEEHGNDILLVTPEEAKEKGLTMDDFANVPAMKITVPKIISVEWSDYKSGKENRRVRRAKQRKANKLKQ